MQICSAHICACAALLAVRDSSRAGDLLLAAEVCGTALQSRASLLPALCCHREGLSELGAALAQIGVPACIPAACLGLSMGVYGGCTQYLEIGFAIPAAGIAEGAPAAPF